MCSYGNPQMIELMRQAVNIAANGEVWHRKHMVWAQLNGFQGHKSLNRHESRCDREHYMELINYCIDMFGEAIDPSWDYAVSQPSNIKAYLEAYLDWEDSVYTRLAAISNDLINLGFPCEAELVRAGMPRKELERVRRWLTEYTLSGWDMAYILDADKRLHDKVQAMEE